MTRKICAWPIWGHLSVAIALSAVWWIQTAGIFAQTPQTEKKAELKLDTGEEIFRAACIACHGHDGKGTPQTTAGFERPATFPDFTDCSGTTPEPNVDWKSIIHLGGTARGFSEIMPSFTEALTAEQINKVAQYLRGFCTDRAWPRGELNLPRAMVTEKAFPEDEAVVTSAVSTKGPRAITNAFIYERRFGPVNQLEVAVPFGFLRQPNGSWGGGVGDMTLGLKRVMAHSVRTGSIFSLSGEVNLPTGDKARGLGTGVTIFEGFAAYGQILPKESFLQFQGGVEVPTHRDDANKAVYARTALGKSFRQDKGFGRTWSPMVEVIADRELATGEKTNWDLVPQVQVTLSRRQHVRASFGYRVPVNNTVSRAGQLMFYLLWDWFDGGLREGWR